MFQSGSFSQLTTKVEMNSGSASGTIEMSPKRGNLIGSNLGNMAAAMIPGAKVDNKGRIMVNVSMSKETIVFNIGGCRFETYRSTLHRLPNSPLADEKFLRDHYRKETKDYFFDRDPDVFRATLNYLRTGELHLPSYLCGPAAKMELEFWGVLPSKIEKCCWTNYNVWNSTLAALNQLDNDRRGSELDVDTSAHHKHSTWGTIKPKIWNFVNNPHSSVYSKCFGFLGLFLVFLSICSFMAGTTDYFTVCHVGPIDILVVNESLAPGSNSSHVIPGSDAQFETVGSNNNSSVGYGSFRDEITKVKHDALIFIDLICLIYFTMEYIVRVVFAPKRLKYVTSAMTVFDLIAILPDYVELIILTTRPDLVDGCEIPFLAFARILRVLRLFRLMKYVPGLWILVYTFKASIGELILLASFMALGIILFSSLIYFADSREAFSSIPEGFWWALITMTTVGYGDMYPTTTLGKLVGSLCAMTGLLMIGLSIPAIVNNFMLYYKHVNYSIQAERMAELEKKEHDEKEGVSKSDHVTMADGFKTAMLLSEDDEWERANGSTSTSNGGSSKPETEVSPLMRVSNDKVEI